MIATASISFPQTAKKNISIAYCGTVFRNIVYKDLSPNFDINYITSLDGLETFLNEQSFLNLPDILLIEIDANEACFPFVEKIKNDSILGGIIIVLLGRELNPAYKKKALKLKVNDYYTFPFNTANISERLDFLVKFKLNKPNLSALSSQINVEYKLPFTKRLFDIVFSSTLILLLSPLFIVIAILIRLESKGKVVYKSKRVGTGYKIFDFYKFRSMRSGADSQLKSLSGLNQYAANNSGGQPSAFVKIKDDPRITKIGHFIRNTSIDELPQLFNILRGDMSVVGNRPLPLYEAEMLTTNEWTMRFLGPAGLTGLWQVSKRGKDDMSERERKKLDNFYAQKYSFWLDFKILLGTFPALLQKEKV
jgi:lipopolysaccharide/colanic/teichoic acid biosynthesis glycosyltransferase